MDQRPWRAAGANVVSDRPLGPGELLNYPVIKDLRADGTPSGAWKAWILSESIRRTWSVATLSECAFLILKQGFAICPGSIAFTGSAQLWDAASPHEWVALCQKPSTTEIPVRSRGLLRLLDDASPSDVDDFTQTLLAYGSGSEKIEDRLSSEEELAKPDFWTEYDISQIISECTMLDVRAASLGLREQLLANTSTLSTGVCSFTCSLLRSY